jgi:hypothetical protein
LEHNPVERDVCLAKCEKYWVSLQYQSVLLED